MVQVYLVFLHDCTCSKNLSIFFSAASLFKSQSALVLSEKLSQLEPRLFSKLDGNWILGERLKTER